MHSYKIKSKKEKTRIQILENFKLQNNQKIQLNKWTLKSPQPTGVGVGVGEWEEASNVTYGAYVGIFSCEIDKDQIFKNRIDKIRQAKIKLNSKTKELSSIKGSEKRKRQGLFQSGP